MVVVKEKMVTERQVGNKTGPRGSIDISVMSIP